MQIKLLDTFAIDGFYLTQPYGTNEYFDYTQFGLLYHEGVDFGHSNKTKPIRCVNGGSVLTGYDSAYGNYVIVLDYSQLCATWYCHLSNIAVSNGEIRKAGDVIGNMGNSGNSSGPHCHSNFVLIDEAGRRLYNDYNHNRGYLDPLHPNDPGSPKKMGLEYNINWVYNLDDIGEPEGDNMTAAYLDLERIYEHFGVKNIDQLFEWKEREEGHLESERKKNGDLLAKIDLLNGEMDSMGDDIKELENQLANQPDPVYDTLDPNWRAMVEVQKELVEAIKNLKE